MSLYLLVIERSKLDKSASGTGKSWPTLEPNGRFHSYEGYIIEYIMVSYELQIMEKNQLSTTLWQFNSLPFKMAIDIVDLPI